MSQTAIESVPKGASNIALNKGEIITVEDALYAVMLPSANEAANGLAEAAAGSIEDFTVEMNERCREIGSAIVHPYTADGIGVYVLIAYAKPSAPLGARAMRPKTRPTATCSRPSGPTSATAQVKLARRSATPSRFLRRSALFAGVFVGSPA